MMNRHGGRPLLDRALSTAFRALALASLLGIVASCGTAPPPERESAPSLAGTRLELLVVGNEDLAAAIDRMHGQWQGETGGELHVAAIAEEELQARAAGGKLGGDAVLYPPRWLGQLAENGALAPIAQEWREIPEVDWQHVFDLLKTREATWGSKVYAVPVNSPVLACFYRESVLAALGKKPPRSWPEYEQLVALLAEQPRHAAAVEADADKEGTAENSSSTRAIFATIEPLGPGWAGRTLLARAAAYARHPNHYSALFNLQTMEPLVASPPFVRALEELVAAAKRSPPRALESGPADAWRELAAGRAALALGWPHAPENVQTDRAASEFADVRCIELPGAADSYNATAAQWERRSGGIIHVPLVGAAGHVGSVSSESKHPEAAVKLLGWLAARGAGSLAAAGGEPAAPTHATHSNASHSAATGGIPPLVMAEYAATVTASLTERECLVVPRMPGAERYMAALDEGVRQAATGAKNPAAALEGVAGSWRAITAELGLEKQRDAYRRSLGLEP